MSLKKFIEAKEENKDLTETKDREGIFIQTDLELLKEQFHNGVDIADPCCIPEISHIFSWKRGFQNCFTGYPNDGKTQMAIYLKTVKSMHDNWKWAVWSPEMKDSTFVNGRVKVHYNDFINDIVGIMSGKIVKKHVHDKYPHLERISFDEYMSLSKWVSEHFKFMDPKDKTPKGVLDELRKEYDKNGFDGVFIDPFKNLEHDIRIRDDIYLDRLFASTKEFGIETKTVWNWIAHPKSNVSRIKKNNDGSECLQPCNQYMLNGGAAWDNGMDGIYSILRPNLLIDINDPMVTFYTLKQKKQDQTNQRGNYPHIRFDTKTKRYLFDERDILNNSYF